MIQKGKGKINEIVYDNTVFYNSKYHCYLSVPGIVRLLKLIIESDETTTSLQVIPFYRNEKLDGQIEFDNMMFYIECAENVTEEQKIVFLQSCCDVNEEIIDDIKNRYCLCDYKDTIGFQKAIEKYLDYLKQLIVKMTNIILEEYHVEIQDLLFGYICFEVYSE